MLSMKYKSLYEKLNNREYFESLCDKRQRELLLCSKLLTEEELKTETSIQVGYQKARRRFIEEYLGQINPELANKALHNSKIPIFNVDEILEELM